MLPRFTERGFDVVKTPAHIQVYSNLSYNLATVQYTNPNLYL